MSMLMHMDEPPNDLDLLNEIRKAKSWMREHNVPRLNGPWWFQGEMYESWSDLVDAVDIFVRRPL